MGFSLKLLLSDSPVRHLLPSLLDFIIWDHIRQMIQMKQFLHTRRRALLQEIGQLVPPCRDGPPVPPLLLCGNTACINA